MEAVLNKSTYEIERGKPMPSKNHAIIQSNLSFLLQLNYRKKYRFMSEVNVILGKDIKVPDLAIYPKMDYVANEDIIKMSEIPLCAIEILSPTQSLTELMMKSKVYFQNGVKSYWLILPELQTVYVFTGINEHQGFGKNVKLKDETLGIELNVAEIFE